MSALTGCATKAVWNEVGKYRVELVNNSLKANVDEKGNVDYQYDAMLLQNDLFLNTNESRVHVKETINQKSIKPETIKYRQNSLSAEDIYRLKGYLPIYNTQDGIYPSEKCVIVTWEYSKETRELYTYSEIDKSPYIYIPINYVAYKKGLDLDGTFKRIILPVPKTKPEWWRIPVCIALTPFSIVVDTVTLPIQLIIGISLTDSFKNL